MATATGRAGIVVGVDGSSASKLAVQWATRDALLHDDALTLVHVLLPPVVMTRPPVPTEFQEWQEAQGRVALAEATEIARAQAHGAELQLDTVTATGALVTCLTDLSKDARFVVVGSHGHDPLRPMLGSVSSGLTQHAHCPVAVVHDDDPLLPLPAFAPVVVGIDGSQIAEAATAIAFDEASRRGVELVAVHACVDWGGWCNAEVDWPSAEPAGRALLAQRLSRWQQDHPEVTVRPVVVPDHAAVHLLEEAKHAQLVVVGSHGRGGFAEMLLGSVSSAVVQTARIPVVVVREP
jgi:nucleotide-binding universal stress UspA family protein